MVVVQGLQGDHATRYTAQKKVVQLGSDAIVLVFNDPGAAAPDPDGPDRVHAVLSYDGGESWSDPEILTGDEFEEIHFASVDARDGQLAVVFPARVGSGATGIQLIRGVWVGRDDGGVEWSAPEEIGAGAPMADLGFPGVVLAPDHSVHVVGRVNTPYQADCDVELEDCAQEHRQVFYITDADGGWSSRTLSTEWTSTVPELVLADDGRLWATWHNEDREASPVGCVRGDVSVWSLDLDDGTEELGSVPGSWLGEGCDADWKTALYPSIDTDAAGRPQISYAHTSQQNGDVEFVYWHTQRSSDGAWSTPQRIHEASVSVSASMVLLDGGTPAVVSARNDEDGGRLVVSQRAGSVWSEEMFQDGASAQLGWPNVSRRPLADGSHGVAYTQLDTDAGEGVVYFTKLKAPSQIR